MIKLFIFLLLFVFGFQSTIFAAGFDHEYNDYKEKISKYINVKNGLINYKQIKIHSKGIANFLEISSKITKESYDKWNDNQKLAFLINLYNVSTIKLLIDNYPIKSIKEIESPWDIKFIDFVGSQISLNNLEHDVIRKSFDDPRIHFALVCAAKGCAVLRTDPFTAAELDSQLEEAATLFFSTRVKNYLDIYENILYLSPIFEWYKEDFEKKSGSVKKYVLPYLTNKKLKEKEIAKLEIHYTDYDWSLNDKRASYQR